MGLFDGLGPALVTGTAGLIGGILANQQNSANTAQTNSANRDIAEEQMQFQERMSSSAYQRAMADMRTAGLNPMLAFSQGGASSPSGAAIAMQNPHYQDPLGPAVASGVDAYQKSKTIDQAERSLGVSQGQLGVAQGQLGISQANSKADVALKAAQTAATVSSAKKTETESRILESRAKKEKLEGDWYNSDTGKTLYQLNRINEAVGGTLDSLSTAKDLLNPISILKGLKDLKGYKNKPGTGTTKDGTNFDLNTGEVHNP